MRSTINVPADPFYPERAVPGIDIRLTFFLAPTTSDKRGRMMVVDKYFCRSQLVYNLLFGSGTPIADYTDALRNFALHSFIQEPDYIEILAPAPPKQLFSYIPRVVAVAFTQKMAEYNFVFLYRLVLE